MSISLDEISHGTVETKINIYAKDRDALDAIDSVDRVLRSKMIKDKIIVPNIAGQSVEVTAVYDGKNKNCVISIKSTMYDDKNQERCYVVSGGNISDIVQSRYKKEVSRIGKNSFNRLRLHDLEYDIRSSNTIGSLEYHVMDKENGIRKSREDISQKINRKKFRMNEIFGAIKKNKLKFIIWSNKLYKAVDKVIPTKKFGLGMFNRLKNNLGRSQKIMYDNKKVMDGASVYDSDATLTGRVKSNRSRASSIDKGKDM